MFCWEIDLSEAIIHNPYEWLVTSVRETLIGFFKTNGLNIPPDAVELQATRREYGDLAVPVSKLARTSGVKFEELISVLSGYRPSGLVKSSSVVNGFLNIVIDEKRYAEIVFNSVTRLGDSYGSVPSTETRRIIVEHVSANPIHPLHIGHLRNGVLGDTIARLLKSRGHNVKTHFYIDDVGLQVAYAAMAYRVAETAKSSMKRDHYVGSLYTMINLLIEIKKLKKELEKADENTAPEINRKISDYMWRLKEYAERLPDAFEKLSSWVNNVEDPEEEIRRLNRGYEKGDGEAMRLVRGMISYCMDGIRETLNRLGIFFDSWDWESEITVWSGLTEDVLEKLRDSGYVERKDGALVFRADLVAESEEARNRAGIPKGLDITPMTLIRSDGTTLYTTRDIAYSIWKLSKADRVINVIAVQQTLAQAQLRLALYVLGYRDIGERLIHYSYEMVNLPGTRMTSRKGVYVAADDVLEEAVSRAKAEIRKRGIGREEDAEKVGLGALKFFFLSTSPNKVLTFDWARILNFEQNSGPFVQYSYVRANSILEKAREEGISLDSLSVSEVGEEEHALIFLLGQFPEAVKQAADSMRPDILTNYLNTLASEFNYYYDHYPVLKAPTPEKKNSRLAVVYMVRTVVRNGLNLLGIEPPSKM
jgi:arginyl-tRNA synthetase